MLLNLLEAFKKRFKKSQTLSLELGASRSVTFSFPKNNVPVFFSVLPPDIKGEVVHIAE